MSQPNYKDANVNGVNMNDTNMNNIDSDNININDSGTSYADHTELNISATDSFDIDGTDAVLLDTLYTAETLKPVLIATLVYIDEHLKTDLTLPYFTDVTAELWQQKPKALEVYITDATEGRMLNLEARGMDYPTNILSYPSDLPANIIELMPTLPLGELIICHEVMVREAAEQDKTVAQHISHLLIHGVLHLLGFDHMLGQAEQDEMESFEIDILARLDLPNPYI